MEAQGCEARQFFRCPTCRCDSFDVEAKSDGIDAQLVAQPATPLGQVAQSQAVTQGFSKPRASQGPEASNGSPVPVAIEEGMESAMSDGIDAQLVPQFDSPFGQVAQPQKATDDLQLVAQPATPLGQVAQSQAATQEFSQTQASQGPLTNNGTPVPVAMDAHWGFKFHDIVQAAPPAAAKDPLQETRMRLQEIQSEEELLKFIYPADLFDGLESEEQVVRTVTQSLDAIVQDTRTHVQIGSDDSFSLRKLTTLPHRKARWADTRRLSSRGTCLMALPHQC